MYQPKRLQYLGLNYSLKSNIYILLVTAQGMIYLYSEFKSQFRNSDLDILFDGDPKFCSGQNEKKIGQLELFVLISLVSDKQLRRDLVNI